MTIRICPERDAPCPHGMECPYNGDRYNCDMTGSRAALAHPQPSPIVDEKGLVDTVPTEVWLAYEDRATAIAHRSHSEATVAIKNAILRFALEARLSGSAALVSPPKAGEGEAVGFRWRMSPSDHWSQPHAIELLPSTLNDGREIQYLYATQQPRVDGVRVKPLEWKYLSSLGVWSARNGLYWAWERGGVGYWRYWQGGEEKHVVDEGGGKAAQAAAQAHFDADILSALATPGDGE